MASPPNSSDAIIFGAGNIGRGLVAQLVSAAGMRPVMVEADVQLARRLREAGSYDVILTGRTEETHRITGYEVLTTDQRDRIDGAVAGAQFAATAVGGAHLEEVARTLAPALEKRATPLSILVCENRPGAEKILADSLVASGYKDAGSSCVKCSVERIVHGVEGSLALLGEGEQTLCADRKTWAGPIIEGLRLCDDVYALYARKLFTNNAGHALLAYLGALAGCRTIHEALGRAEIRTRLDELLDGAGRALGIHYGMDTAAMRQHLDELVNRRYPNRRLADTVKRVARDPLRKLGPDERLAGLARLLESHQLDTAAVSRVIGAALRYHDADDAASVRLQDMIRRHGPGYVLDTVCGFGHGELCYKESLRFYAEADTP